MLSILVFDLLIDLLDKGPISVIQAFGLFHRKQYQTFFFPNFFCPFQPQPQIIFSELHIFLTSSFSVVFKVFMKVSSVRT